MGRIGWLRLLGDHARACSPVVRYWLPVLVSLAVILYFDTFNRSELMLKQELRQFSLSREWLYLLLHMLSSGILTGFLYRAIDGRAERKRQGRPALHAFGLATAFSIASEIYQTATLPYHVPAPDLIADILGVSICLAFITWSRKQNKDSPQEPCPTQ